MQDLISRQAAIDVIEAGRLTKLIDAETAVNGLKELPSAETELNTGHWVSQRGGGYCCSLPNKRWVQVVWENGEYSQIDVGMKHDMALIRAVAESIGW